MSRVFGLVLDRLCIVFGQPKSDNVPAYLHEYARKLEIYSDDELGECCDSLIDKHKWGSWPTIAEAEAAASDARKRREAKTGTPFAGVPGEGWRMSGSGERWWQIEKGTEAWARWMRFFEDNGRKGLAKALNQNCDRWCVPGPDPAVHGPAMMEAFALNRPQPTERNDHNFGRRS